MSMGGNKLCVFGIVFGYVFGCVFGSSYCCGYVLYSALNVVLYVTFYFSLGTLCMKAEEHLWAGVVGGFHAKCTELE